jgi:phospholipid/cholesterol/gamma-HCH transport system substrate-binding protein
METRASYILVGAFVIALFGAAFAFVIFLARVQLERATDTYVVNFTGSVTGLEVGGAVRYRGVPVGSVASIRMNPDDISKIRVMLDIEQGTPIKEDTVASLGLQGITGVAFVTLSGGTQSSPPLKKMEGREYPEIRSTPSSLEKVLEGLPTLLERASDITERLSLIFDERNREAFAETLENLRKLTAVFADRSDGIGRIVGEATDTAAAMRRTADSVDQLAAKLNSRIEPLGDDASKTLTEAQKTLAELRKATQSFSGVAEKLDRVVDENRRPLHDFSANGLYELSQFVTEARVLVTNLNQLAQQIQRDPARFFFGDTQKGYEAK